MMPIGIPGQSNLTLKAFECVAVPNKGCLYRPIGPIESLYALIYFAILIYIHNVAYEALTC